MRLFIIILISILLTNVFGTKVFILAGQSNMQGHGEHSGSQNGTLENFLNNNSKISIKLKENNGDWIIRDDVWHYYKRTNDEITSGLSAGQGAANDKIGPELGFGQVLGDHLQDSILIIKTAWGGKSLTVDFLPPSSDGSTGPNYSQMIDEVNDVLSNYQSYFPSLTGKTLTLSGFGWFQGWNDACCGSIPDYADNLANLIRDIRTDWNAPDLPIVIAESGHGGDPPTITGRVFLSMHDELVPAQRSVADLPEFNGTVISVRTWDFWRGPSQSPADAGHHWNNNGESYFLIGEAMGEAMKTLLSPEDTTGIIDNRSINSFNISNGFLNYSVGKNYILNLMNIKGEILKTLKGKEFQNNNLFRGLNPGLYIVNIKTQTSRTNHKIYFH